MYEVLYAEPRRSMEGVESDTLEFGALAIGKAVDGGVSVTLKRITDSGRTLQLGSPTSYGSSIGESWR